MRASCTVIFLCTIGSALAHYDVAREFKKFELVPDVLDEAPHGFLEVKFGEKSAQLGNELTPTEVKDIPEIHYNHVESSLYTLVMLDPDVPSRGDLSQGAWQHWLVGNIPGEDISKGDVIAQFVSSAAPEGSGLHRYTFLVYKQPGRIEFDEPRLGNRSVEGRFSFSTKNFAIKYNLGDPLAGNMYQAAWDEYVPIVHRQLGLS